MRTKAFFILLIMLIVVSTCFADRLSKKQTTLPTDNSAYVFKVLPMDFYKPSTSFTIAWTPNTLNGKLYYSTQPGGSIISNYIATNYTGTNSVISINNQNINAKVITTSATSIGIGPGIYYCVIHDAATNQTSLEFQLIIEATSGAIMVAPANGSVVSNNATPTFSWNPVPGVPYYHLVLSDSPFSLEYDDDDNLTVSDLNAIWQIITPNTSAVYGAIDPSGNFTSSPPPLTPGTEYNWVVLNNFGNDPLYSSDVTSNPSGFTYQCTQTIPGATLISPSENAVFNNINRITFSWNTVTSAVTYHVYVYEVRNEAGSEVLYPIWNQITTNTLIDFDACSMLIDANYIWKVIATNANGTSSVSTNRQFTYHIPIGTLEIRVTNPEGVGLGFASAVIDPVDGSQDNVPLTVKRTRA